MKKIVVVLLAVFSLFSLAACVEEQKTVASIEVIDLPTEQMVNR